MRGFDKVRGEWSLMALCYNFSRVLRIIGLDRWKARLAQRAGKPRSRLVVALRRACCRASRRASARFMRAHPSAAAGPRISAIMTFLPSLVATDASRPAMPLTPALSPLAAGLSGETQA